MTEWEALVKRIKNLNKVTKIALVGKYVELHDAYLSVVEALHHAGFDLCTKIEIKWIDSETINESNVKEMFSDVSGIILPGGFGKRGIDGMVETAKYARINNIPFFGICLGMQIMCIEFARNVLNKKDANSNEFDEESSYKIIDFLEGQSDDIKKGGTLRLGAYPCKIKENSKLFESYQEALIIERHRHRYEFNNKYRDDFVSGGMNLSGTSPDNELVEAVEITNNKFYLGVQYHPEFKSRPNRCHPLFKKFIEASLGE
jgi:CTP synthase